MAQVLTHLKCVNGVYTWGVYRVHLFSVSMEYVCSGCLWGTYVQNIYREVWTQCVFYSRCVWGSCVQGVWWVHHVFRVSAERSEHSVNFVQGVCGVHVLRVSEQRSEGSVYFVQGVCGVHVFRVSEQRSDGSVYFVQGVLWGTCVQSVWAEVWRQCVFCSRCAGGYRMSEQRSECSVYFVQGVCGVHLFRVSEQRSERSILFRVSVGYMCSESLRRGLNAVCILFRVCWGRLRPTLPCSGGHGYQHYPTWQFGGQSTHLLVLPPSLTCRCTFLYTCLLHSDCIILLLAPLSYLFLMTFVCS